MDLHNQNTRKLQISQRQIAPRRICKGLPLLASFGQHQWRGATCSLTGAVNKHSMQRIAEMMRSMSHRYSPCGRVLAVAEPADFLTLYNAEDGYETAQEVSLVLA